MKKLHIIFLLTISVILLTILGFVTYKFLPRWIDDHEEELFLDKEYTFLDMSIHFEPEVSESVVLDIKNELEKLDFVDEVDFESKDDKLDAMIEMSTRVIDGEKVIGFSDEEISEIAEEMRHSLRFDIKTCREEESVRTVLDDLNINEIASIGGDCESSNKKDLDEKQKNYDELKGN